MIEKVRNIKMDLLELLNQEPSIIPKNSTVLDNFVKAYSIINRPQYKTIFCSISGGSDSDVMMDIIYKVDVNKKVTYVWFDTGLEYEATKRHIEYLEKKYDVKIMRERELLSLFLQLVRNTVNHSFLKMYQTIWKSYKRRILISKIIIMIICYNILERI